MTHYYMPLHFTFVTILIYFNFQAKRVFEKMCPGEEFLPKAPNPEDIIYDDGETGDEKESGFEPEADTAIPSVCDIEIAGDCSQSVNGTASIADEQDASVDIDNNPQHDEPRD